MKKKKNSCCSRNGITGWELKPPFLLSIWPNILLSPGKFLFNRKPICLIMKNLPKYILKPLCPENMSLPSGLDREASSNCFFRGHLTKHHSGTDQKSSMNPLLIFHAQKFNAMSWVTQLSEKIEWLRKGLEWFYPKTRKYGKEGLTTVSRGHDHLYLKCSWPLQEHRGFSCCRCRSV